jgi:predicted  nucleic acid-binding Zn-ribbon protein
VDIEFDKLILLQELDKDIKEVTLFLGKVPSKLVYIDAQTLESDLIVSQAQDRLSQNQKKRRDLEADIQDQKQKLSRYKSQLNNVKTNIEYSSLLKEIADVQKKIDGVEEHVISEMLESDELEEEIKTARAKAEILKDKFAKEKADILQQKKDKELALKELRVQRSALVPEIPDDQMKIYNEISQMRAGQVLSPVNDEFCAMCYMRVRPQMLNELKTENQMILCENCGRILYFDRKST